MPQLGLLPCYGCRVGIDSAKWLDYTLTAAKTNTAIGMGGDRMPIPDFQSMMLPLLKSAADKREHHVQEPMEKLADVFQLSDDERKELLPSGADLVFNNRIRWARFYLGKAGLVESTRRGFFKISQRGLNVLNQNPSKIDIGFLEQFPEFLEFRKASMRRVGAASPQIEVARQQTPEESLEYAYQGTRQDLAQQLLDQVKGCSPSFFERLVVDLLVKMGYGGSRADAGKAIGRSGDGGIDGIIKEDRLGLDIIYIQAKRWEGVVGRPEIQKFAGALQGLRARKGIFITTSSFTNEAQDFVERIDSQIVLIDGEQLAQLMIDYDIGVSRVATYDIKRVDSDYFAEE